ncbi:hypothetical protein [Kribbella sp. NPDC055071]
MVTIPAGQLRDFIGRPVPGVPGGTAARHPTAIRPREHTGGPARTRLVGLTTVGRRDHIQHATTRVSGSGIAAVFPGRGGVGQGSKIAQRRRRRP